MYNLVDMCGARRLWAKPLLRRRRFVGRQVTVQLAVRLVDMSRFCGCFHTVFRLYNRIATSGTKWSLGVARRRRYRDACIVCGVANDYDRSL